MPFCFPGLQNVNNIQGPLEWSDFNLLACASENTLVVIDTEKLALIQTLTKNKNNITQLSWQPAAECQSNSIYCATADCSGSIVIWDIVHGKVVHEFSSQNVFTGLKWLSLEDEQHKFCYLISLSTRSTVTLYDSLSGFVLWTFKSGLTLNQMDFNPFKYNEIAFVIDNVSLKFTYNFNTKQPFHLDNLTTTIKLPESHKTPHIRQIEYNKAYPNRLFLLLADRVVIMHTETKVFIYSCLFDNLGAVTKIFPCSMRDAFYSLRSSGVVNLNVGNVINVDDGAKSVMNYDNVVNSETQRMSNKIIVKASALCPLTESKVAVLLSNGRLVVHQLWSEEEKDSLVDFVKLTDDLVNVLAPNLRFSQRAYLDSLGVGCTHVRVRPMNATKNLPDDLDSGLLAAVGSTTGAAYLVDVLKCKVVRVFQIHSCQIRALEWGGSDCLVTAAYSASLSSSTVRNDLFITNIRTGQKKRLRPETEESQIELLRVSYYHCYLAVSFRREPLEIWDLKSRRLLRRMSKKCPIIMDMNWFARHTKTPSTSNVIRENLVVMDVDNHLYHVVVKGLHVKDGKEVNTEWSKNSAPLTRVVWKDDYLVFGDTMGFLRIWDLGKKKNREIKDSNQNKGSVLRMVFSSLAGDYTLSVLHQSYIAVWDVESLQLLQRIEMNGLVMLDVDMSGVTPVYMTSAGSMHYGAHGEHLCAPIPENDISPTTKSYMNIDSVDVPSLHPALKHVSLCHRLQEGTLNDLPTYLNFLWSSDMSKKLLLFDVGLLLEREDSEDVVNYIVENAIVLKKNDWATSLLLDKSSKPGDPDALSNAFKACLISADVSKEESRCLIKMVATNLIASGKISEGVQLLYLIDQKEEACKYLMSQGFFDKAYKYLKLDENCEQECLSKCLYKKRMLMITPKMAEFMLHASKSDWSKCTEQLRSLKLDRFVDKMGFPDEITTTII
ncbi:unnamed protein product [Bursaphelenchus okinawaensis]|uniref:WD_REPEATS_REGION domain-containing protein n=1 Tax=Bursaphelenchus okinawaensis TaxID=465554 RepID=A0A811JT43_9BILA|nr:unnamed protein product [Bursaphelenchus okinawaensis]CAG9082084.1 unnamed protein product [Bursaphelenchus okinawaensis]